MHFLFSFTFCKGIVIIICSTSLNHIQFNYILETSIVLFTPVHLFTQIWFSITLQITSSSPAQKLCRFNKLVYFYWQEEKKNTDSDNQKKWLDLIIGEDYSSYIIQCSGSQPGVWEPLGGYQRSQALCELWVQDLPSIQPINSRLLKILGFCW